MATTLQNRPTSPQDDQDNPTQAHYDREFDKIAQNYNKETAHPLGEQEAAAAQNPASGQNEEASPSRDQLRNRESQAGDINKNSGLYRPEQKKLAEAAKRVFNRRTAIIGGVTGGGITAIVVALIVFMGAFKLPSLFNSFEADLPSSRMTRLLVERPFKRVVVQYLVAKKAGNINEIAKPNSALGRLYKMFDAVDLEKMIKDKVGIELINNNGTIHIYHKGRDVGTIRSDAQGIKNGLAYTEWKNLERKNRAFGKASGDIVRKAVPIFRFGTLGSKMRSWLFVMGLAKSFTAPQKDSKKSDEENIKQLNDRQIDASVSSASGKISTALACLDDNSKCSDLVRQKQPVDTSDSRARLPSTPTNLENDSRAAQIQEGVEEIPEVAKNEGVDYATSAQKVISKLVIARIGIAVVGWIDLAANLARTANTVHDDLLLGETIVDLRETQAMAIATTWWSHSDNIKDGNMDRLYIKEMNDRIGDPAQAAMYLALSGKRGGEGALRIGSAYDWQNFFYIIFFGIGSNRADYNAVDVASCHDIDGIVDEIIATKGANTPFCLVNGALWSWYNSVGHGTRWLSNIISTVTEWLTKPAQWAVSKLMSAIWGEDWQQRFVAYIVERMLGLLGILDFDPTARGPSLVNSIGVGMDVIFNRYMQTNLGAKDITDDPEAATAYLEAERNYKEYVASLPLKDRLFSSEIPSSLVSKLAISLPSTATPSTIIGAIINPIKSLPSTFMSVISGRSSAAVTPQFISEINGVAQFGGNWDEIDADIPTEITEQEVENLKDVECPENADGFFNNCQRYKEIIQGAMCLDTKNPCPEWSN